MYAHTPQSSPFMHSISLSHTHTHTHIHTHKHTHTHTHTHTGLLTVDAKNRLTLENLTNHPWLAPQSAPSTPLQTSCVLERDRGTASALKQTFHAFIQATRAGFTLGDVSRAPLAKRRKRKRGLSPANPATNNDNASEVSGSVSSCSDTVMGIGNGSESGTPNRLSVSPIPHHARPSQLEL